jgi:hypothetical protein
LIRLLWQDAALEMGIEHPTPAREATGPAVTPDVCAFGGEEADHA